MSTPEYSTRIPHKAVQSLVIALVVLAPIAIWNRYVFLESNLPYLLVLLLVGAAIWGPARVATGITFPGVSISFVLFILYAWLRLDHWWEFEPNAVDPDLVRPGLSYVLDLIVFYLLFIITAILSYRYTRVGACLWFLVCGYIAVYVIHESLDIGGLQQGYNLSPGYALVTLLPFVFLGYSKKDKTPLFPSVLLWTCSAWLALIGARMAVGALVLFYIALRAWPIITRKRAVYFAVFWGLLFLIACLTAGTLLQGITDPADPVLASPLIEDAPVHAFGKRLGSRVDIWLHLSFLIAQRPMLGYGTDQSTAVVSPLSFLTLSHPRVYMEAHSLYFELLYRLGAVGLLGFIMIMFSIWRAFWRGREEWAVRVAGAFLLSALLFASTGGYLIFHDLQLRSGFGWIILGIGAGACLRAVRDARVRSSIALQRVPENQPA
jgi:hypothetical protein